VLKDLFEDRQQTVAFTNHHLQALEVSIIAAAEKEAS
jgi:hypothetical protein